MPSQNLNLHLNNYFLWKQKKPVVFINVSFKIKDFIWQQKLNAEADKYKIVFLEHYLNTV